MKTAWLARKMGLDGNPLRRRADKIAACLAALLLAAFLAGGPLLSMAAVRWAGGAQQQAVRSWHRVSAVLLQSAPAFAAFTGDASGDTRAPAQWTAPDGQARAGRIWVSTGLAAGSTVPLWVDATGSPAGTPPSHLAILAQQAAAAVVVTGALGTVLACLAWAGRRALDRRRLADWEAAWAAVGPQWTRRFRSRG